MAVEGDSASPVIVEADRPSQPAMPQWKKAVFATVAVLLVLGLLEGAGRLLVPACSNARWEVNRNGFVTLGFPALTEIFEPDPTLFWRVKPNLDKHPLSGRFANAPLMDFRVSTDHLGFRCMPPTHSPCRQILFLGNSCTFGLGVEDGVCFPAMIQARCKDMRCINAGVPGYTAYQGRVLLGQIELQAPPDIVVITFGHNDSLAWDRLSDLEHARLINQENARLVNRSGLVRLVRRVLPDRGEARPCSDEPKRPRLTDAEFTEEVRSIIQWCRHHQAEPVIVVWPHLAQMPGQGLLPKQAALVELARSEGVRLVNLVPRFRNANWRYLFLDLAHASPAGCKLVADALTPVLQEILAGQSEVASEVGPGG
jgi:lysophospholipase L1-like esterase